MQYLLQPDIVSLTPDTIAVYIQAAAKIFGYWAAEIAERWSEDDLSEVKSVVEEVVSRVNDFVGSPHTEVQERVSIDGPTFTRSDYRLCRPLTRFNSSRLSVPI